MKVFMKKFMAMTLAMTLLAGFAPYSFADEINASETGSKIEAVGSNDGSEEKTGVMEIKLGMAKFDQDGNVSQYVDDEEDEMSYETRLDSSYAKTNTNISYLYGSDRYETSVQVSKASYPNGADAVVLVNSSNAIYGLIATPFASLNKAPILLTSAKSIKPSVLDEIIRLNPKKVYMIGDTSHISKGISNAIKANAGAEMARIFGTYPSDLSAAVAEKINASRRVNTAYVVSTEYGVADALSISSRAGSTMAPVLVASKNYVGNGVYNYLKSSASNVYYIGGQNSISNSLINNISAVVRNGGQANRIYGSDRYQTNVNVINRFYKSSDINSLIVTKAENSGLIDTVSAGPFATLKSCPILITHRNKLVSASQKFLNSVQGDTIYQIGGGISSSVTSLIKSNFQSAAISTQTQTKPQTQPQTPSKPQSQTQTSTSDTNISSKGIRGKTIVIDPGHGGSDSGAVGLNGYKEKDWTLKTALACADYLTKAGANVIMTRKNDTYPTLQDRVDISNNSKAVFFCSIHYNKGGAVVNADTGELSGTGVEVYTGEGSLSQNTASKVLNSILAKFDMKNRGVKDGTHLYVIANTEAPAILVEGGFMSNSYDVNKLKSDQSLRDMGIQIAKGIVAGFN